jgi:hypothetical protein
MASVEKVRSSNRFPARTQFFGLSSRFTVFALLGVGVVGAGLWQSGSFAETSAALNGNAKEPLQSLSPSQSRKLPKPATATAASSSRDKGGTNRRFAQAVTNAVNSKGANAGTAVKDTTPDTGAPPASSTQSEWARLKAQRQAQRTAALKEFLTAHNVSEEATQTAIINQIYTQEEARRQIQEAGRKLLPVLGRKGMPVATEAQANAALVEYEKAVKAFAETRRQGGETLATQVGADKNPRLRALLVVLGLIGDGPTVLPL